MLEEYVRVVRGGEPVWTLRRGSRLECLAGEPWQGARPTGGTLALEGAEVLPPARPGKIVCVGLNDRDHAREMGLPLPAEPLLFLKAPSSLLGPGRPIRLPRGRGRVDHEAELAFVVGRQVGPGGGDLEGAIFGYCCANDVTAREVQAADGQWARAKSFDTFCPLGPALVRGLDAADLAVECRVNGALRQASRTGRMIFGPQAILAHIAACMTLIPGDLVLTGTYAGVGPLAPGDTVEVRIEGLGTLANPVQGPFEGGKLGIP